MTQTIEVPPRGTLHAVSDRGRRRALKGRSGVLRRRRFRGVAQSGSAQALGACCRGFKSRLPDQNSDNLEPEWTASVDRMSDVDRLTKTAALASAAGEWEIVRAALEERRTLRLAEAGSKARAGRAGGGDGGARDGGVSLPTTTRTVNVTSTGMSQSSTFPRSRIPSAPAVFGTVTAVRRSDRLASDPLSVPP